MLVKESLYEFQKGLDPVDSLGMGRYKLIKDWLDKMGIEKYGINDDYTIDVNGTVDISDRNLHGFPEFIQFDTIYSNFYCDHNELDSLRGCPKHVEGMFVCSNNNLKDLRGFPEYVGKDVYCRRHPNNMIFTKEDISEICDVRGYIYVQG